MGSTRLTRAYENKEKNSICSFACYDQRCVFFLSLSDDCPAAWAEFEGRKGVFIEGQITPPLSGVQIVISSGGEQPITDIKVETDTNGKYRLV